MPILRPKIRMISLRLTESEYTALLDMTAAEGIRGTSDLARIAICDYLNNHHPSNGRDEMQRKIEHLENEVTRLSKILEGFASLANVRG
jgi:hypothetical protein